MEDKYIVAIEIGSSKIRGALASVDSAGALNVLAVQDEPVVDAVRYGHVKNVEEVSNKVDAICHKLENARIIQPRKIKGAYVGVSGSTISAAPASETSRFETDTEIDAAVIDRLKDLIMTGRAPGKDIYAMLPFEYIVDNESTLNPVGRVGRFIKGSFNVIEGSHAIKSNLNRVFPERLGLTVNGYIVSALAQADIVLSPDEKQLGCMFVDFGCETTTVVIYKKGVLRYLATLPMGSRNITRDLVALNNLEEHAESIKRSIGIVNPADSTPHPISAIEQPELNSYISARAGEIVANVIANIEFAGLTAADLPSGMIIVGGGARLKGLSDMIAAQSKMKVRMGTTPRNVRISDTSISPDEITDIIALLITAAQNPVDCLSPVVIPEETMPNSHAATRTYDDYDDGKIRIGLDEDEYEDDYEDDEDEDPFKKHKGKGRGKGGYEVNGDKPEGKAQSVIKRIQSKLTSMFRDDESDKFDIDE